MNYFVTINRQRANANGQYPITVVFKEKGQKEFRVNTGLHAENFAGRAFPKTESNYRAKTARLTYILNKVEEYILTNADKPYADKRAALTEIVSGKKAPLRFFADYVDDYMATKERRGTATLYRITAAKVRDFDPRATFDTITADWLGRFERHYLRTMEVNGIAIQLRNIRAVFNWAIDNGWTDKYPFRRFKIRQEKAAINNITVEQLRQLRDYPCEPWQEIYRDLFMLSFYLCGINVGDMLLLTKDNVRNGRIVYKRQKTGRLYDLPLVDEAKAIIERHKGEKYLLSPMDGLSDYHTFTSHANKALKKIGTSERVADKVGKRRKVVYHPILPNITTYTARYTFASIGAKLRIPRETIALCLGHAWSDVTSHYISYDNELIDEAVRRIVDYVNEG